MLCPDCKCTNPDSAKFCNECGCHLAAVKNKTETLTAIESERKHVTIMFSDMSGYTNITERLDPEEVKEIMSHIFGEITSIIYSFDGFIERFIGDAVMAVFGVPKAHEDDPIRAIKSAIAIHSSVEKYSSQIEDKVGRPLTMHTGINTGLVVTGQVDIKKGTHGLIGDAINLASRLEGIARAGEIVVGPETYKQAFNYYEFETLAPVKVKGKKQPVSIYKVRSAKKESYKTHRLQGLQAILTGRDKEMKALVEAAEWLKQGQGSIITISGDAGTGKSRLKKELKDTLDLENIQWREGHAYGYAQNMPYYPLINLLTHAFQIEEDDLAEGIRKKVETSSVFLLGEATPYIPYIGSLFALSYPEIEGGSPEYWKDRLGEAIQALLSALVKRGPTVICFEDLHWADPSFIELLKSVITNTHRKTLFICTYRSHFTLFDSDLPDDVRDQYRDIRLKDFTTLEAQEMLRSLLDTRNIPEALYEFVQKKTQGNPFYIEEMVNSLIESEILIRDKGKWQLTRQITEADIPATIHGLLAARIDRLGKQFKRILQEASVIGRAFLYKILERITDINSGVDDYLSGLENLDLIRTQSMEPELEYIFKHALTQEVVYNGLLKKDRQILHERIATVVEELFKDRLSEFYETLAFHFNRGGVKNKAIFYLMKSGEKSLKRYSVEESHKHYQKAFDIISDKPQRNIAENELLIDIINRWALVFYYRGDFKGLEEIMRAHMNITEAISDKTKIGIFYSWFGFSLFCREKIKDAFVYLRRALRLGEQIENQLVICSACTWLTWTCADLGLFEEGLRYGERAQKICKSLDPDSILFFQSLGGISFNYFYMGECQKNFDIGNTLIDHGTKHASNRSLVVGHIAIGHAYWAEGDLSSTIAYYQKAVEIAKDPFYLQWPRLFLGMSFALNGQFKESEPPLRKALEYGLNYGCESIGTPASLFLGVVMITEGHMKLGLNMVRERLHSCKEKDRKFGIALIEYILGRIFFQLTLRSEPMSISNILKNAFFLIRYLPVAEKKAMDHFHRSIEAASEIGAQGIMGQTYFDLGTLYKVRKRINRARDCYSKAVQTFEQCGAINYLQQAREALESLSP
jgi:class 3 adenylate cyclase/tetratricopeptide (TPR) repeat protein